MTDETTKVTIRMGSEDIQMMEDYMSDNDIGNRSDFIREAISGYINSQRVGTDNRSEGGIFIRLNEVQLETLEMLKRDGICFDTEEFARKCILDKIIPVDSEQDSISRAFKAAQHASRLK